MKIILFDKSKASEMSKVCRNTVYKLIREEKIIEYIVPNRKKSLLDPNAIKECLKR